MGKKGGFCLVCNKFFFKYRPQQQYCSPKCREKGTKAKYKYRPKPLTDRICPQCGEVFESNDSKRVYCCLECYQKHWFKYHPNAMPKTRKCFECGEEFTTDHGGKKYCCEDCYLAAKKRRETKT